ncbi:Telomere length regulation protein [Nakaseomyces glabratus]
MGNGLEEYKKLTTQLEVDELVTTLDTVFQEKDSLTNIDVILTVIKYVVSHHQVMPKSVILKLNWFFSHSLIGFSQLIKFGSDIDAKQSEQLIYIEYVTQFLKSSTTYLQNYLIECTENRTKELILKRTFTGSTVFNFVKGKLNPLEYIELLNNQLVFALDKLDSRSGDFHKYLGNYIASLCDFHNIFAPDVILSKTFLIKQERLETLSLLMKRHQNIPGTLGIGKLILVQDIFRLNSFTLQKTILAILDSKKIDSVMDFLLMKFHSIEYESDNNTCQLIVTILKNHLNDSGKIKVCHSDQFLNAITKRLSDQDKIIRERSMYIAKIASNHKIDYESDFTIDIGKSIAHENYEVPESDWSLILNSVNSNVNTNSSDTNISTSTHALEALNLDDSDDEEDEEGDQLKYVFLKDLTAALENKSQRGLTNILKNTVKLVRQKKLFRSEVAYYAGAMIRNIVILNNDLDEKQFEELRVNALVSILVVVPEKIDELLKMLFTAELSLQQRLSLLLSVSMSARELRGYDDKQILKPQFDFPTSMLPWDRRQENNRIEEIDDNGSDNTSGGKVLWKSSKLTKNTEEINNRFREYASKFFYPLANGWLNGIDLGTFDKLFKTYYLSTLKTVYNCAYPVHGFEDMTTTMDTILQDAVNNNIPLELQ